MTVYVDQLPSAGWGKWNGGAHMLGSDLDELHALARIAAGSRMMVVSNNVFVDKKIDDVVKEVEPLWHRGSTFRPRNGRD